MTPPPPSSARAITCPNCGGSIAVKAAGYSVSVGCQHCGALLDVASEDVAVIEQYAGAMRELPVPLGRRGVLYDTEWEAIGALARSAWAGFQRAAQSLADGRFDGFTGAASGAGLNGFFGPDAERR